MKSLKILIVMLVFIVFSGAASAQTLEIGVSGWYASPNGDLSYAPFGPREFIDLDSDLGFDEDWQLWARAKINPPILPGFYLQATSIAFDSRGDNGLEFSFGNAVLSSDEDIDSDFFLNIYDAALYFEVPLIKKGTLNTLGLELGVDGRVMQVRAEVSGTELNGDLEFDALEDSRRETVIYPLVYGAIQINPTEYAAIEGEAWAYSYDEDKIFNLVGRLKLKPVGPLMLSAGYRGEIIDFEKSDLVVDANFAGPFVEVGVSF